ncbi:transglycosylase family protein [Streptomyces sp. NPDC050856]|uniref:transglycosylase family protein n=1 Tax=Streptomyces sp. NPDC050856 TaxID=3154939 RepID=UPI0033FA10E6
MTGSAIALPLLGAGSASAADSATWDRVAECESGGMWSADLGNGFYGGLQFSQETWEAYGGTAYAPRADLASRAQQIAVAEKVYAAKGSSAWETCAPIAGLAGGASAGKPAAPGKAEPSGTPSADPSGTAAPADPLGSATPTAPASPSGTTAPTAPASPSAPSDTTAPSAPAGTTDPVRQPEPGREAAPGAGAEAGPQPGAGSGTGSESGAGGGKHRGEPAKDETGATGPAGEVTIGGDTGNSVTERETGAHASRGDGTARDLEGVPSGEYTVRAGDTLWAIAHAHQLEGGWAALYDANREALGADPDLILPGQSLDLDGEQG